MHPLLATTLAFDRKKYPVYQGIILCMIFLPLLSPYINSIQFPYLIEPPILALTWDLLS